MHFFAREGCIMMPSPTLYEISSGRREQAEYIRRWWTPPGLIANTEIGSYVLHGASLAGVVSVTDATEDPAHGIEGAPSAAQ